MIFLILLFSFPLFTSGRPQFKENLTFIGSLNTDHYDVEGDVYAKDHHTIVIKHFSYNGKAADAVFWAGESSDLDRIKDTVILTPDGDFFSFFSKTPFLEAYNDETVMLTLPERINVEDLEFLSVWSKYGVRDLGYLMFPHIFKISEANEEIEENKKINEVEEKEEVKEEEQEAVVVVDYSNSTLTFIGSLALNISNKIQKDVEGDVYAADHHTIVIKHFSYNGKAADAVFWAGESSDLDRIMDTVILTPDGNFFSFFSKTPFLEAYNDDTVTLTLPERINVEDLEFLTVWSKFGARDLGLLTFPQGFKISDGKQEIGEKKRISEVEEQEEQENEGDYLLRLNQVEKNILELEKNLDELKKECQRRNFPC